MKKHRLASLLLAIVMIVGLLPTMAFAANDNPVLSDATGESYTIKNGAIKLFVPYEGYEGSEVIDADRDVTWSVKGNTGTLSFSGDALGYFFYESFWIDGCGYIDDVVVETSHKIIIKPNDTSAKGLRVSNASLSIQSRNDNLCFFISESILVENGNFTTRSIDLDLPTATKELNPVGLCVKQGNATIDSTSSSYIDPVTVSGTLTIDGMAQFHETVTAKEIIIGQNQVYFAINPMSYDRVGISDDGQVNVFKGSTQTTVPYEDMFSHFKPDATVLPTYDKASTKITGVYWKNTAIDRFENWMCFSYTGTPFATKIYSGIDSAFKDKTYMAGENFDLSTLKITAYLTNNSNVDYRGDALPAGMTVTGDKSLKEGSNLITVHYNDLEASIEVKALPNPNAPSTPGTDVPKLKFIDVPENAWYYKDVMTSVEKSLFNGKTSTTFAPNDNMTVGEAVKLAACMHQLHKDGKVTLANGSPWYTTYMKYAVDNGITADLTSRVGETITRQEYVSIFYKALPESEYAVKNTIADNAVSDVKMDNPYAKEIYAFYRAGIVTGGDGNAFKPETNIQRCEVAAILVRMMEKDARKTVKV